MTSRAERSDQAAETINAEAQEVRIAIDNKNPNEAAKLLEQLETKAAQLTEHLGPYDARRVRENIAALSKDVAKLRRKPKFSFRAAPPPPKQETTDDPKGVPKAAPKDVVVQEQKDDVVGRTGASLHVVAGANTAALRMRNLTDCTVVVAGVIGGSAVVRGCNGCVIALRARQIRLYACVDCVLLVHSRTAPILEECRGIVLGAYERAPDSEKFELVKLDGWDEGQEEEGLRAWEEAVDFDSAGGASNNYRLLRSDEKVSIV